MDRSLARVRIFSVVAGTGVVALALVLVALYRVDDGEAESAPVSAVPAFLDAPQPTHVARRNADEIPGPPRAATAHGQEDDSLRLWRYGQHGEIIFSYAEQFDRCSEARRKHIDQADCPSSRETRLYVLEQNPDAPLVLAYRRH